MSQLSRKDVVLIVVTVILFLIMVGGFIYDSNGALLDRTNLIPISKDENLDIIGILLHPLIFIFIRVGNLPYHILHENCCYQEWQDKEQTVFEELLHRFSELKVNKCLARTSIAGNNHDDDVIDAPTHKPIVERLHIGEL